MNRRLSVAVPLGTGFESADIITSIFKKILEQANVFENPDIVQQFLATHLTFENKSVTKTESCGKIQPETQLKFSVRKLIPKVLVNAKKTSDSSGRTGAADKDVNIIEVVLIGKHSWL